MKGILKIYHPEETLKYHLQHTYCKAVFSNMEHLLELDIVTDDSLDHVEDDSLQYHFPQLAFKISDFPVPGEELSGLTLELPENAEESFCEVDLYDDEDAFVTENTLSFQNNSEGVLTLHWQGQISDFLTGSPDPLNFKLKCDFSPETLDIEED